MPPFKPGDLVVLKSGGPTMTVDAVNTDIFDDDKITGIVCAWFVGEKLERVRFDHRALEHAQNASDAVETSQEATGQYKAVLDEMVDALNQLAEDANSPFKVDTKRPRVARAPRESNAPRAAKTCPD
jgi:uncharacterized protein YodC (DUF2158 family)